MVSVRQDRRHTEQGSIVCENGVLRLRVVRPSSSLGLVIEARDSQQQWLPLATTPSEGKAEYLDATGAAQHLHFYAYDPLLVAGHTRGIILHGHLGEAPLTLTTTLSEAHTWTPASAGDTRPRPHSLPATPAALGACLRIPLFGGRLAHRRAP